MVGAVEETSGTTPGDAGASSQQAQQSAGALGSDASAARPSFAERGRARRRARYLRKARELAYRDLGGLVFDLHRFSQRNDALVLAKLSTLERIDAELRALEGALAERQPLTVLREAGVTACARCAAIHSSEDRFCPNCGLSLGPHAERPAELLSPGPVGAAPAPAPTAPAHAAPAAAAATPAAPSPPSASAPLTQRGPAPGAASPDDRAAAVTAPGDADAEHARSSPVEPAAPSERGQEDDATVIIRPSASGK